MLTREKIEENRKLFLNLLRSIQIPNCDIQGLEEFLDSSDFYHAPASTIYHASYLGGLCEHSLNVWANLDRLCSIFYPNVYTSDEIKVVALLHDLAKINYYEPYERKQKKYHDAGKMNDKNGLGNYDWETVLCFKVRNETERMIFGTHGFNSFVLASRYIALTEEQVAAIVNHHAGMDEESKAKDMTPIMNKYPLVTLLHMADMLATYIDERLV